LKEKSRQEQELSDEQRQLLLAFTPLERKAFDELAQACRDPRQLFTLLVEGVAARTVRLATPGVSPPLTKGYLLSLVRSVDRAAKEIESANRQFGVDLNPAALVAIPPGLLNSYSVPVQALPSLLRSYATWLLNSWSGADRGRSSLMRAAARHEAFLVRWVRERTGRPQHARLADLLSATARVLYTHFGNPEDAPSFDHNALRMAATRKGPRRLTEALNPAPNPARRDLRG
jgi:hypothetical protein